MSRTRQRLLCIAVGAALGAVWSLFDANLSLVFGMIIGAIFGFAASQGIDAFVRPKEDGQSTGSDGGDGGD